MPQTVSIDTKPFLAKLALIGLFPSMNSRVSDHICQFRDFVRTLLTVNHLVNTSGPRVCRSLNVVERGASTTNSRDMVHLLNLKGLLT